MSVSGIGRPVLCATALALSGALSAAVASQQFASVHLSFAATEQLHSGNGLYEAWLLIGGVPQSLGRFNLDADQRRLRDPQGDVIPGNILTTSLDVAQATELWITIEPASDSDALPAYRFLAGTISPAGAGTDSVSFDLRHANGLHADFTAAGGSFVLATPTSASTADETSGLWFMAACGAEPAPTLALPPLPSAPYGWMYEPVVTDANVTDAAPVFLGTFTHGDGPDADAGGCAAGPLAAPAVPGADFVADNGVCVLGEPLLPAFDSGTWAVVLDVAPAGGTSPLYGIKPLQLGAIPAGTTPCASVTLTNVAGALPRGTATIVPATTAARPVSWGAIKGLYR